MMKATNSMTLKEDHDVDEDVFFFCWWRPSL